MIVLGVDPGQEKSAVVQWDGVEVRAAAEMGNLELKYYLAQWEGTLGIEWIRGYGLKIGNETLDTVFWIGRFCEAYERKVALKAVLIPRKEITWELCNNRKAGDTEIRAALIDRIGIQGTKKSPGPLRKIAGSHLFSALSVAVVLHDRLSEAT